MLRTGLFLIHEIPYAHTKETSRFRTRTPKMGKAHMAKVRAFRENLLLADFEGFWPLFGSRERLRRGDREKETQQSNARISRLCEREVKACISRSRESDNSARESRQREEEDKIKIF